MLWQSLRALCVAPGRPGSIWNYLGAPVRSTGVSRRYACGFRTDLHFADANFHQVTIAFIQRHESKWTTEQQTSKGGMTMWKIVLT